MPTDSPSKTLAIEIAGESAVIVYAADTQSVTSSLYISSVFKQLRELRGKPDCPKPIQAICNVIPAYQSILVEFNPLLTDHASLSTSLFQSLATLSVVSEAKSKTIILPVFYDVTVGLDLLKVAAQANLNVEQVIKLHQASHYQVQAIGFAPGFAYLGDVDSRIALPRLKTPRAVVPKGAVAIANQQTAVYPAESPGGWNIIGLCPTRLFNPNDSNPLIFDVGDTVQFKAISKQDFLEQGGILPSTNSGAYLAQSETR